MIAEESADAISSLTYSDLDHDRLAEDMQLVGRPIVGLVKQIREQVGEKHARDVHFGTTTQDILDTVMVMQVKQSLTLVNRSIDKMCARLKQLIDTHGDQQMIGRTNNQYALPITFGSKLSIWQAELTRRRISISAAAQRGLTVQIGGPVGDLGAFGDKGELLKRSIAECLNINYVHPHWQNARDGIGEIMAMMGLLSTTLLKIAQNISLLSSSDIAELREQPESGKGASSSMNHKQNQRCSEFAEALARMARQRSEQFNETSVHQHERSGNVWISEWLVVPDVFLFSSGALMWTQRIFENLEIDSDRMNTNLGKAAASY